MKQQSRMRLLLTIKACTMIKSLIITGRNVSLMAAWAFIIELLLLFAHTMLILLYKSIYFDMIFNDDGR